MQGQLTTWIQENIRAGNVGSWEGNFPKYVWCLQDGIVYEARLINQDKGEYKGYQLEEDEWPPGIEKRE